MTDRELMRRTWEFFSRYILVNEMAQESLDAEAKTILEALRARLAQPEQKPVAKVHVAEDYYPHVIWMEGINAVCFDQGYLYIAPPQRDEAPAKAVEWQGLTDEELHLQAAAYATYRKNIYVEGMKQGEVDPMSEEALNGKWLAHYEGYREGYWVATGDDRYTIDPAKLKEKNNAV